MKKKNITVIKIPCVSARITMVFIPMSSSRRLIVSEPKHVVTNLTYYGIQKVDKTLQRFSCGDADDS